MSYTLKMRGVIVGRSELERADSSTRTASGVLRPGLGWDLIQPIFRLHAEAVPSADEPPVDEEKLRRYHAARERLGLELFDRAGRRIPTDSIHVTDRSEQRGPAGLEIEIVTSDPEFWAAHGRKA